MRIILHIGIPKTGTKTIQWFLRLNQRHLKSAHKILVSECCLEPGTSVNHTRLSAFARRDDRIDDIRVRLGMVSSAEMSQFRHQFMTELLDECHQSDCDTLILSSESCSSRLFFGDEIHRLRELLDRVGRADIILYLRRQDQLWISHYSTGVKLGYRQPIEPPTPVQRRELLDYEGLCVRWADVFGDDALHVRIFDPREFANGDLITDFLCAGDLNIDPASLRKPERQNRGLDPKLLEFLRRFNEYLPFRSKATDFKPDPRQGNLMGILERLSTGGGHALPGDWHGQLVADFAEGNRKVAERFLGRADGVLFREDAPDGPVSDEAPSFTISDAFEIFSRIWAAKHES